jgi:uncharacterized protein (TIGR02594 family)
MSDAVKNLQTKLKASGQYAGRIDGAIGPLTLAAIEAAAGDDAPAWMPVARAELGVSEIVGTRHNPRIVEYHTATDLAAEADEIAWCSSFVNWCVRRVGGRGTRSAAARSWLNWGSSVPLVKARYGDIVILARGSSSWQGHVGFYVFSAGSHVWILGGNQSNRVSVAPYGIAKLLGVRRRGGLDSRCGT